MLKSIRKVGVVTCGGLCPGLNDIVRGIVLKCYDYNINTVYGIQYGFKGFELEACKLTKDDVKYIHLQGGSILGTSRERLNVDKVCSVLREDQYDVMFVVGGNGGNAAASILHEACQNKNVNTQIIALPKSIDNDIHGIDKCFGFDTAVEEARKVLLAGKVEAGACLNGVCIVKVMGRDSGFIAAHSSFASGVVDICLIPEVPFTVEKLVQHVKTLLEKKSHIVICIAEGVPMDISVIAKSIQDGIAEVYMKVIEPSYLIRAVPTTLGDHMFCTQLAFAAVEAAIKGYSGITVATKESKIEYFNTKSIVQNVKVVNLQDPIWTSLHQPNLV